MSEVGVRECGSKPCADCPWRTSNQGTRRKSPVKVEGEPFGWFTKANLKRLWAGLRAGERMSCHPTDPRHHANPEHLTMAECAGALALQQRELMVLDKLMQAHGAKEGTRRYRRERKGGLTPEGAYILGMNHVMGTNVLMGTVAMGSPDLNADITNGTDNLPWPPEGIDL